MKKDIVIAALARDCEKALINNIPLIEELRKQFESARVIVIENDSKDNTKKLLKDWQDNSEDIKVISQDFGTKTIPTETSNNISPLSSFYRVEKMAFYRNMYLEYINELKGNIDYVIIIDIDILEFSVEEIVNSISNVNRNWGGIFSNGITTRKIAGFKSKIYFDIFALYEYPFKEVFCYSQVSFDRTFKSINKNIKKNEFYSIISAFGGIGIYRYEAIKDLRYEAIQNPNNELEGICEHVSFNTKIVKKGYNNYISRNLIVDYGTHGIGLIFKLICPSFLFNFLYKEKLKFSK